MNPVPTLLLWCQALGTLALQVALLTLFVAALQPRLRTARARRFAWLVAVCGLGCITLNNLLGLDRPFRPTLPPYPERSVRVVVRHRNLPSQVTSSANDLDTFANPSLLSAAPDVSADGPTPVAWPVWIWLAGALAIGLRMFLPRALFAAVWHRRPPVTDPLRTQPVAGLAPRLGLHRPVRLVESATLVGPVAFGWLRPTIGLPASFWTIHTPAEQEAMLAHELAHLAEHDPCWHALTDLLTAVLWWHPLVWWTRRQFREASEAAADEASLVLPNGPSLLAGCLVTLAGRLGTRPAGTSLGMAGFRSSLGRRVERLLHLPEGDPRATLPRRTITLVVGLTTLVAAAATLVRAADTPAVFTLAQRAIRGTSAQPPAVSPSPGIAPETNLAASVALASLTPQPAPQVVESAPSLTAANPATASSVPPAEPQSGSPDGFSTRTYRLDPNSVRRQLAVLQKPASPPDSASWVTEETNRVTTESLLTFFRTIGVDFGPSARGTSGSNREDSANSRALFFNETNGILLVRATRQELDTIEVALQALNEAPPQIMIEAQFVELTETDATPLGFDGYLGSTLTGTTGAGLRATNAPVSLTSITNDPQFRALVPAPTNGLRELRGDQLDWAGRNATNAQNFRISAELGAGITGVLTDPQYRVVLRALETRAGVDVLSAPRVTTLSGRQAQIQVVDLRTVMTGINPAAVVQPGAKPSTNVPPLVTTAIPVGPTLDIIPTVASDGVTIELNVIPTVTEFLGYDPAPKEARVRVWMDGKVKRIDPPLPRFRVREMRTLARVADGQTLVLGGLIHEDPDARRAGAKDRSSAKITHKRLLVFITPTLIDPAGNRVHAKPAQGEPPGVFPLPPAPAKG